MMRSAKKFLVAAACMFGLLSPVPLRAGSEGAAADRDSSAVAAGNGKAAAWLQSYWHSLIYGNVDRTFEKPVDLSFAIAPSYSREGSVGIGGTATALYRLDRSDSLMQASDVSLTGNVSVKGFYTLMVKGNNNFKGNRSRLNYRLAFKRKNLDFWGVSYAGCTVNPVSSYTRQQLSLESDYSYKILGGLYLGAALRINYTEALNLGDLSYLEGQDASYYFTGIGLSLMYDTRDLIVNPKKGVYFLLREIFYPEFLSSYGRTVFNTTLIFDAYQPLWRGSVLALDIYGDFNSRNAPWTLRPEMGSDGSRMRGYYSGRYIDCCLASVQLELRQHIYGRLGCAAWAGAGASFSSPSDFKVDSILPNFGIGLRFEFKHNMNIRIDYGFGKGTSGLVAQFSEAF